MQICPPNLSRKSGLDSIFLELYLISEIGTKASAGTEDRRMPKRPVSSTTSEFRRVFGRKNLAVKFTVEVDVIIVALLSFKLVPDPIGSFTRNFIIFREIFKFNVDFVLILVSVLAENSKLASDWLGNVQVSEGSQSNQWKQEIQNKRENS